MKAQHQAIFVLVLSIIAATTTGPQYSIGAWSPQLKADLNCTQSEIETVGTLGNFGAYLGPITGVMIYALPEVWVGIVCLLCVLVGLTPMALAIQSTSGTFSHLRNTTTLGVFFAIGGFGTTSLYSFILAVNLSNFLPNRRGSIVASLATLFGLSASGYTAVYNGPLHSNVANFFWFLMALVSFMCFLCAIFVRRVDPNAAWDVKSPLDGDHDHLSSSFLDEQHDDHHSTNSKFGINKHVQGSLSSSKSPSFAMQEDASMDIYREMERETGRGSIIGGSPPISYNGSFRRSRASSVTSVHSVTDDPEEDARSALIQSQEAAQVHMQSTLFGGGLAGSFFGAIWFLMHKVTFWLLLTVFFCISGTGLMVINNAGHLVQSLNDGKQDGSLTTFLILMLSLGNGSGRLIMALSDYVRIRKGVWLFCVCCLMILMQFIGAFVISKKDDILILVVGTGLAYGGLWAIIPIIVSDNFGSSSFPMNFGWVGCVPGVASIFFNYWAGRFYDDETPAGTTECVGTHCYRSSFILNGCAAGVAAVLALILIPRTELGKRKKKLVQIIKK